MSSSELMDILVNIVIGEVLYSYANVIRKILPGDIRIILKKIQSHEIATAFAPLGNLEDLAENIFPAVETKLEKYSKKAPSYKTYLPENIPPLVRKYFTGKEFGINRPKGILNGPHPGPVNARWRQMSESARSRKKAN